MENNERFLPIGSVVILKGGKRELMIMSYCVMPNGGEVYDKNGKVEESPLLNEGEGTLQSRILESVTGESYADL
jgi:hypothetical protein